MLDKKVSALLQLCQTYRAMVTLNMRQDYTQAFKTALLKKIDELAQNENQVFREQIEFALVPFPEFLSHFKKIC